MKILSINLFFKEGSTGKIVYDIHMGLINNDHISKICYGLGYHNEKNIFKYSSEFFSKLYTYIAALTGMQYMLSFLETEKLLRFIKQENPDIVHIHVINCNTVNIYKLLEFLKKNNQKTVITFHAEYLYTGGCSHAIDCMRWKTGCGNCPRLWNGVHSLFFDFTHYFWRKFESIYNGFEDNLKIICVSPWLKDRASQSPFFQKTEIEVIENGIDTHKVFYPRKNGSLYDKYKTGNKTVILHVTPSFRSKIKGGEFVIELAKKLDKEKYTILIIGYDDNLELPQNIVTVNRVLNQDLLAEYYSLADLTLITSKVETYSMVCVESLSCGTPVIGFKCGGLEQIALKEFSDFVQNGNIDKLEELVYKWENKKSELSDSLRQKAKEQYSTETMVERYIKIYNKFSI
jgi:glycosyltransferase involved in cell wall biosynthesis